MKNPVSVFKFGGASIKDASAIKNVTHILNGYKSKKLLIVVSALGKTTNELESVVEAHIKNAGNAVELLNEIKHKHYQLMGELFVEGPARAGA